MRHGDEFYGGFASKALLAPSRQLILKMVIPRARLLTGLLIVFQLLVAFSILGRGNLVELGLIAATVFCFSVVFVSNVKGAIALIQISLILMR